MRIVADTNVVVSGLFWPGAPRQLMDLGRAQQITLTTSVALLAELAEVLGREKFLARIRRAGLSATGLVEDYAGIAHVVEAAPLPHPVARDPDDDQMVACALAANANAMVSGDKDLLVLGEYRGIRIVTARKALNLITRRESR